MRELTAVQAAAAGGSTCHQWRLAAASKRRRAAMPAGGGKRESGGYPRLSGGLGWRRRRRRLAKRGEIAYSGETGPAMTAKKAWRRRQPSLAPGFIPKRYSIEMKSRERGDEGNIGNGISVLSSWWRRNDIIITKPVYCVKAVYCIEEKA